MYCVYQKNNKKRVYHVNNKDIKNQPKGFYITFEDKKKDVTYLNKDFNKVIINFVEIEITYLKCQLSFLLKSKLHKYVKANCIEEALSFSFAQLFSSIPIVLLKAIYQFLGSGLIFKGWTYATTSITLTPEYLLLGSNPNFTTCLDIGCEVTFINQN